MTEKEIARGFGWHTAANGLRYRFTTYGRD